MRIFEKVRHYQKRKKWRILNRNHFVNVSVELTTIILVHQYKSSRIPILSNVSLSVR